MYICINDFIYTYIYICITQVARFIVESSLTPGCRINVGLSHSNGQVEVYLGLSHSNGQYVGQYVDLSHSNGQYVGQYVGLSHSNGQVEVYVCVCACVCAKLTQASRAATAR